MADNFEVLTVEEAARMAKVSSKTIYRLVARRILQRIDGLGVIRITRKSFDNWVLGSGNGAH